MITALTVNYNTPNLLETLLSSFRKFYDIPYLVVDGSSDENFEKIECFADKYKVTIHHFPYNINHGAGMRHGIRCIETEQILLLDSDVVIIRAGFIEDLQRKLKHESYGIGSVGYIDQNGESKYSGIKYLHPSCALLNREIVCEYPMPRNHGAPMIDSMKAIPDILQHEQWVTDDLIHSFKHEAENNHFIHHSWSGTFGRGGMNL
jgi:glycosyltransferase involved in cell wall biosynthesis